MTREELKEHCKKQIENCEMWSRCKGEEPHGKVYEEHRLILELLEQEPIIDKIRAKIEQRSYGIANDSVIQGMKYERAAILEILDKYKAESEGKE